MSVICEHCGKKTFKYAIVSYELKWLESYLVDYFERSLEDVGNKHIVLKRDKKFRNICMYVLNTYGKMNITELGSRFRVSNTIVYGAIANVDTRDVDFIFIDKDLSHTLPETERA